MYVATQKYHLNTHVHAVHEKLKPIKCDECHYATAQKCNIERHKTGVHLK